MLLRKTLVAALAALAMTATLLPAAQAQDPTQIFGVSVVEGPGTITSAPSATKYGTNDALWQQCKPLLEAAPDPDEQLPAPLNGGVFFPCFGPPATFATTHFKGESIQSPDPVNAGSFCASTLGPCISEATGFIGGNAAGGVTAGAYCGSSKGTSNGHFETINFPTGDPPIAKVSYNYTVSWAQSGGTILPLVGEITTGPNKGAPIVGFVSSRTTSDSRGTCGRPSSSTRAAGQLTFAVDGMAVSFDPTP